jgi:hypothetical protein
MKPIKDEWPIEGTYEVSANEFIEAQTRQIEREFKCSKPRPRNKAMGFKGDDRPRKKRGDSTG